MSHTAVRQAGAEPHQPKDAVEPRERREISHQLGLPRGGDHGAVLPPTTFPRFSELPSELRLKIWSFSFERRVVEIHRRRAHYADDTGSTAPGGIANTLTRWQSRSANPAALAVSYEARAAALDHYTVTIRLGANTTDLPGESRLDPDRRLYLAPHTDTLAMLGEFNVLQTSHLLRHIAEQDQPAGIGLKHLALGASSFCHPGYGVTLVIYSRTVFQQLDNLTLFLYGERTPPAKWQDGHCFLADCEPYYYRRFKLGRGSELKSTSGDGWMTVGKSPLCVKDIIFGENMPDDASLHSV